MRVQIAKRSDRAGVLRCVRDDGSASWQKQSDRHAAFFALHDLTHFSVETTLGYKQGFFGLVAEGWEIDDTTGKGSRGPLPAEAVEVEALVGLFFMERTSGTVWTVDEFNAVLATHRSTGKAPPSIVRQLTAEELAAVRNRRSELFRQWEAISVGESLDLVF